MLVVKAGGAQGVDLVAISQDIAALVHTGQSIVIVHGGSDVANQLGTQLGHPPRFLTSPSGVQSRYTDTKTLEILTMAMAGCINPSLVVCLLQQGVHAIGLTGLDGLLVQAQRKSIMRALVDNRLQIIRDDWTGRITQVNLPLLQLLLQEGYVPVLSPPAFDPESGPVNVDADRMAAAIASALGADALVLLSNVPGILRDVQDLTSVIPTMDVEQLQDDLNFIRGRMKLKCIAAQEALAGGVKRIIIGDGRQATPVKLALAGCGTVLQAKDNQKE